MEAQFRKVVSGDDARLAAQIARAAFATAAGPYGLAVAARNRMYDVGMLRSLRVARPVISIGNLTLGGTGKTPFVEFVCRWFLKRGEHPAILSRGYRSTGAHNDEALLLGANLPGVPHLQGKDRVALARRAIDDLKPDVLVLDDGFQHRRLARNLDIVLIDCTEPFGYGRLFPRGLLREPIRNLRRASLIVLSRANQCSAADRETICHRIIAEAGEKPIVLAEHRPTMLRSLDGRTLPLADLAGRSVAAFCGIGNPQAFWQTLESLGGRPIGTRAFRDHHRYSPADLADLETWTAQLRPDFVITTQKDMVKISPDAWSGRPLYALQIEAAVTDPDGHLDRALAGVLDDLPPIVQAA
jgi:tetraacyldisaccharide 4'-kinase